MKEITIKAPEGYEIDTNRSDINQLGDAGSTIVFKKVGEWPTSWNELHTIEGFYINNSGIVIGLDRVVGTIHENQNVFATKEQAEASKALAKITQLLKAYNGDWVPDWADSDKNKWVLRFSSTVNCWSLECAQHASRFVVFNTKEKGEHFLKHHIELLETAKPLLG